MPKKGEYAAIGEVMLIDDEPIDLFINEKLLSAYGFANRYLPYQDAMKALKYLEDRLATGQSIPSVIFLDYFMPQIDGLDFVSRLSKLEEKFPYELGNTRVIMLTTLKAPEKRRQLSEFDRVFKIMTKPLSEKSVSELNALLFQEVH